MKTAIVFLMFVLLCPTTAFSQDHPYAGEHKTYYSSGELKSQVTYVAGKKHGIEQFFDKNGRVLQEYYYQRGERQGEVIPEPEMNFGEMRFVKSPLFWMILLAGALTIWFMTSKILLKKRPF
jgi:hypothetical protein